MPFCICVCFQPVPPLVFGLVLALALTWLALIRLGFGFALLRSERSKLMLDLLNYKTKQQSDIVKVIVE
jgi:hypothetical protein